MSIFPEVEPQAFTYEDLDGKVLHMITGTDMVDGKETTVLAGLDKEENKLYILGTQIGKPTMDAEILKTLCTKSINPSSGTVYRLHTKKHRGW